MRFSLSLWCILKNGVKINGCGLLRRIVTMIAAFVVWVALEVTYATDLCPEAVRCRCGRTGENVTVCASDASLYPEACARFSNCESCDEGTAICSKCPEGFYGPFCNQEIRKFRQKHQSPSLSRRRRQMRTFSQGQSCPTLDASNLGSILCRETFNGTRFCIGKCWEGYHFHLPESRDEVKLACHRRVWKPQASFPKCVRSFCRNPGRDWNSSRQPSAAPSSKGFPLGSRLEYACDTGYLMEGAQSLICESSGEWSDDPPKCARRPATPSRKPCSTLDTSNLGSIECKQVSIEDEVCTGKCWKGYHFQYSKNRDEVNLTCHKGVWKPEASFPKCVRSEDPSSTFCRDPGSNVNSVRRPSSSIDMGGFFPGSRIDYSCDQGYSMDGAPTLFCLLSGEWTDTRPRCVKNHTSPVPSRPGFCDYPGDVSNGQVFHYSPLKGRRVPLARETQYPAGIWLEYSCNDGFTLEGTFVMECLMNGRWSSKPPTCRIVSTDGIAYCDNLGSVQYGSVKYHHPPDIKEVTGQGPRIPDHEWEEYPEGGILEYKCEEGYKLSGSRYLICQDTGRWSARQPTCEIDCGHSYMQTTGKVLNGNDTSSGEWPWVVSISLDDNKSAPFICGGAILNPYTVITAAHCLEGNMPLLLRFGKHHFDVKKDDAQVLTRRSSQIIIHDNYNKKTFDSDIGLIFFRPRIPYSIQAQPICLPTPKSTLRNLEPRQIGYVGGWGDTEMAVPPDKMMLASLPLVTDQKCMEAYKRQNLVITQNMFCAGYEDARQSVCSGDSGSPLVFYNRKSERYTLEGLVSYGVPGECGVAGNYAIFTKVFEFLLWINKNLDLYHRSLKKNN